MDQNSISPDLLEIFQEGISEILPLAQSRFCFSTTDICSLNMAEAAERAEKNLGKTAASGLFFRAGTAGFKYLVRKHGKTAGIDSLEFRMQPQRKRLLDGVEKITALQISWKAAEISLGCNDDNVILTVSSMRETSNFDSAIIRHHFIAGMIQEFLCWAGSGKQYPFQVKPDERSGRLVICFQLQPTD